MPLSCPNPLCPEGGTVHHLAPLVNVTWCCSTCDCRLRHVQTWQLEAAGARA